MDDLQASIDLLAKEFEENRTTLLAIGDGSRQHLILEMMRMRGCGGARVGAIAQAANLSRPAVSHHIQILKNAGIVKVRKEGTKNYYYFDVDNGKMNDLLRMLEHAKSIMAQLPDRSGEE